MPEGASAVIRNERQTEGRSGARLARFGWDRQGRDK